MRADVAVWCLTRGEFYEGAIRELGTPVEWLGESASRLRRLAAIAARARRERPEILQSTHFYANLYVAGAARAAGCRDLGAVRSDANSEAARHGWLGRASLRWPRTLVANSRAGAENAVRLGVPRGRVRLLPNVVDTDLFRPAASRPPGPPRILACGRLAPEKRFDRFLRLAAALPGARFRLVGDGPLRASLEGEAEELGLRPERFLFLGERAEVAPLLREADLLVLTSEREGTPNAVLEAMASGVPVVATDVGGVSELVEHGATGLLVPEGDEGALREAVERLLSSEAGRRSMGERARAAAEEGRSVRRLPALLADLYGESGR
jgi:glycosyltransferase involved in cell wall biosynthesis